MKIRMVATVFVAAVLLRGCLLRVRAALPKGWTGWQSASLWGEHPIAQAWPLA
jgi:hypothetical protein